MSDTSEDYRQQIDRYRQTQIGVGWHTAPDDGSLYDHLAEYLKGAGLADELRALFADQAWMRVRVAQGTYSGYLADLQIAWEVAEQQTNQQIDADQDPAAMRDLFHLALIETSLRTWAEQLSPSI